MPPNDRFQWFPKSSAASISKERTANPLPEQDTAPAKNSPDSGREGTVVQPDDLFDEARIRQLFAGSEEEIGQGLALVDASLRQHLCVWLRRQFPSLTPEDLADVWGETLVGVLQAARQRRFQPDRPLLPWLCHIARARAIDHIRRRTVRQDFLAGLYQTCQGAMLQGCGQAGDQQEMEEVLALVRDFIDTLPQQQRMVLFVFVEHYPETQSMAILQREVSRTTGRPHSRASVKRALQEARRKLREHLRNKGFDLEGMS